MNKANIKSKYNFLNLGFALVELIFVVLFSFIILNALIGVTISTSNQLVDENNRRLAANYMNLALDMLVNDISMSTSMPGINSPNNCGHILELAHIGEFGESIETTYSCDKNRGILKDGFVLIPFKEYYSDLGINNKLQIEKFKIENKLIHDNLISNSSQGMRDNTFTITLTVRILDEWGEKIGEIEKNRQIFYSNGFVS